MKTKRYYTGLDNNQKIRVIINGIGFVTTVKGVFDLYKGRGKGSTLPTAQDTLWGLLNAVTEHVDHYQGRSNDTRIRSAWFGQGENLKLKAKDTLLTMLAA